MSATGTARPPAKPAEPRDQIDRDYNAAAWPEGFKPELARAKQLPQVLRIPPGALGMEDRGRRVDTSKAKEQTTSPAVYDLEDAVDSCIGDEAAVEIEHESRKLGGFLDVRLFQFLRAVKTEKKLMRRFAAICVESGGEKPSQAIAHWKGLTKPSLKAARRDLRRWLKGGAR
jgi:hypothetical protein